MKNLVLVTGILALFAFTINAQQGGYTGPTAAAVSIAEALKLRDDAPVVLKGNIAKSFGNNKYEFVDASGKIMVEIDSKVWTGITVDEKAVVEISGEIDKEPARPIEVDVKSIKKI